jgi:hypothetical protein
VVKCFDEVDGGNGKKGLLTKGLRGKRRRKAVLIDIGVEQLPLQFLTTTVGRDAMADVAPPAVNCEQANAGLDVEDIGAALKIQPSACAIATCSPTIQGSPRGRF